MIPEALHDKKRSALDAIEHELYDPKVKITPVGIHHTQSKRSLDLPSSWGDDSPVLVKKEDGQGVSFGTKLLLISTVFLIGVLAFAAWRVISLKNVVSSANIDMSLTINPFIEGGEASPLILTLHNRNTSPLQSARITLLYKQGNGSQDEQEKVEEKRDIGDVQSNEYKKQDFSLVLYGSESETRDIVAKIEYKVPGSNAVFTKVVTTQVILRTPPISVAIEGPSTIASSQVGEYSFIVKNNSATTSAPAILQVQLPTMFLLKKSVPKSISRSNAWAIKPLAKGETQTIVLTGTLDGKQNEILTFSAKVGSQGDNNQTIGIVYAQTSSDVKVEASPLALSLSLMNNASGQDVLRYGDRVTLAIQYHNGSDQALEDISLTMLVSGEAAMYLSIDPTSGYYDSSKKSIVWNKSNVPDLAVIPPGASGEVRVVVPIISKGNDSPVLSLDVQGTASSKSLKDVSTTLSKTYAVEGGASLISSTQYKTSSITNTGPIPPRPNQETTYTVALLVSAQNTLAHAKTSFVLPVYVTWRGVTTDSSAVHYDTKTRTVTWEYGRLEQGKVASIEIGLSVRPSQSHVGGAPPITSGIILDAQEEVSHAHLRVALSPLTTALKNEMWPENPSLVVDRAGTSQ